MKVLEIIKLVIAIATVATGAYSMLLPGSIRGFTGLIADGPRGVTEIRAVMGGVFIALGLAPFILGAAAAPSAYRTLGLVYLIIAVIRAVSMFVDGSLVSSNWISLAVEIVFGVILML